MASYSHEKSGAGVDLFGRPTFAILHTSEFNTQPLTRRRYEERGVKCTGGWVSVKRGCQGRRAACVGNHGRYEQRGASRRYLHLRMTTYERGFYRGTTARAPRYDLLPNGHRLAKLTLRGPDPSAPPVAASDCSPSWGPTGPPPATVAVVGGAGEGVISTLARVRGDGTGAKLNRSASRSGAGGADSAAGWAPAGTLR